jgi:hypothetical protein
LLLELDIAAAASQHCCYSRNQHLQHCCITQTMQQHPPHAATGNPADSSKATATALSHDSI